MEWNGMEWNGMGVAGHKSKRKPAPRRKEGWAGGTSARRPGPERGSGGRRVAGCRGGARAMAEHRQKVRKVVFASTTRPTLYGAEATGEDDRAARRRAGRAVEEEEGAAAAAFVVRDAGPAAQSRAGGLADRLKGAFLPAVSAAAGTAARSPRPPELDVQLSGG